MRLRQAHVEERQIAFLWGVAALAAVVLRPFWLAVAPFLPGCPFRALAGVPCPTCGSTHAALALLRGHPLTALAANPLCAAGGMLFIAGGLIAPIWVLLRGPLPVIVKPLPFYARAGLVTLLLVNWAWVIVRF